jgi:hypothetical protein
MRRPIVLALVTVTSLFAGAACRGTAPQAAVASDAPSDATTFTGTVAESMDAGGYTYARLQADGRQDIWVAAAEFPAAKGERLTVDLEMPVLDFESKTLGRTFPLVYFVSHVSRNGEATSGSQPTGNAPPLMRSRDAVSAPATVEPIPPPAGGLSIAELWARKAALSGTQVTVRGRVVKVNTQILGRNWVHLQDGSGSASDGTNDLTITTDETVTEGATITVTGILATGKDFGSGYVYAAIVENGKVVK